jgi:hypothetical protein
MIGARSSEGKQTQKNCFFFFSFLNALEMACYEEQGGCLGDLDLVPKAQLTGREKALRAWESFWSFGRIPSMSGLACLRLSEYMRSPLVGREAISCVLGDAD